MLKLYAVPQMGQEAMCLAQQNVSFPRLGPVEPPNPQAMPNIQEPPETENLGADPLERFQHLALHAHPRAWTPEHPRHPPQSGAKEETPDSY